MTVATTPNPPDLSQPPVGRLEIHTEAEDPSAPAQRPADPEEVRRQVKLGLLLVQLGVAKESNIFGPRGLIAPPRDLLVINRYEDSKEARRPFKWYDPISWFLSGPKPSPMFWNSLPTSSGVESQAVATAPPPVPHATISTQTPTAATAPVADSSVKRIRAIPPLDMQPLPEGVHLETAVRSDREKLLKDEEALHKMLSGLEDTRNTYLVPAEVLQCESEVDSVVQCYERYVSAAKTAAAGESLGSEDLLKPGTDLDLPAVAGVLQCGPVVSLLRRCAEGIAGSYSRRDATP